eukprot:gene33581-40624_t
MHRSVIRKIPQAKLGVSEPNPVWFGNKGNEPSNPAWTNPNWLKSRFHFSFAEYSNSRNMAFGVLRVMNDDLVQPNRGFGAHPHRDVEICTYVVEGKLTHQDSMGTEETLGRGSIQFMTAGTGVTHSEHNLDVRSPLRFIQIWINTRQRGLKPNYGSMVGDAAAATARRNKWAHLVADVQNKDVDTPIKINQDANIFVSELSGDQTLTYTVSENRQAYFLCMEGDVELQAAGLSKEVLNRHDAAELYGPLEVQVKAQREGAHVLVVEMQHTGQGRSDL